MDDAKLIKAFLIVACTVLCFWFAETLSARRNLGCRTYRLQNGEVSFRSRNRLAKHRCDFGYVLIGHRLATCVRGRWNKQRPVCASPTGCESLELPLHGFLSSGYYGALTYYNCDPGYTLIGTSAVYCDGEEWNGTAPICVPSVRSPVISCNFEEESLCGWSQDTRDDFNWLRNQFSTPSGRGTGPSHDHTFGIGRAGHYLYIEASAPRNINDTARLFSPVVRPGYTSSCFTFWYHMFGATIGSLRVYIKKEDEEMSAIQPVWKKDGEQGPNWLRGAIEIPELERNYQVVIEGVRGSDFFGDIAIDDVELKFQSCQAEPSTQSTAFPTTTMVPTTTTETATSQRTSDVTTESTTGESHLSITVTNSSTTLSTTAQPITYETTESIDLFTSTHVSVTDKPISSSSVADVITPSQLRSIDGNTSSTASTTDWLKGNTSTIRWRTKKQNAVAQVSKAPSGGVLAAVIVVAVLISLAGAALFIYFKRYRFKKDKLSEDSDMRYLSSSEEVEYIENYHSSSCLDELTAT